MNISQNRYLSNKTGLSLKFLLVVWMLPFTVLAAEDPFKAGVRPTDPLNPLQEKEAFQLPSGFEIELVASEPEIAKPMNMAFDYQGRLWVTDTVEYPFPVPLGQKGRDSIKVLTDTTGDGRFDQITTFASGLNIPIGLYPYKNGVVAWSIPNIWWFEDTDGDGKADIQEKRFGPLGWERDTHGMNSSFTRGFDGWLYATHGFNNNTTIKGSDGSEIFMNSGNTYRIRLDGSRVEQHTYGQVNPFGMCLDPLGHFYTADCHSAPVYQLLRGAYYPSFGKPHDGLGFGPALMTHAHGSTAICGIVFYDDDQWPMEYRENVFIGNVMTSRLNRDGLLAKGASRQAREMPDLLKTTDPWFRPVNLQLGPDGALYIADFYNKIIGHYEVPLKHPERDRERGRIWKLSYKGSPGKTAEGHGLLNLSRLSLSEMIHQLGHPNITRRMLTTHYLVDHVGKKAGRRLRQLWNQGELKNWKQRVHALWVMDRLEMAGNAIIGDAVHDLTMEVRTHAMRILSERQRWTSEQDNWVVLALQDDDANVQRAAADALSLHASFHHIRPLLKARENKLESDPQWLHGMRLALRNQLRDVAIWKQLKEASWNESQKRLLGDVALAIQNEGAADYLIRLVSENDLNADFLRKSLQHAVRFASAERLDLLGEIVPIKFENNPDLQLELFQSVQQGLRSSGVELTDSIRTWGTQLANRLIQGAGEAAHTWTFSSIPEMKRTPNPWFLQTRRSSDGDSASTFLCSLPPGGETFTGIMTSPEFNVPGILEFYLAGHDGFPDQQRKKKNGVRLIDANSGRILKEVYAPRNDTAQHIKWNLEEQRGSRAHLEIVDADDGSAYAWLAVGRISPNVVSLPESSPKDLSQRLSVVASIAGELHLKHLKPTLKEWVKGAVPDVSVQIAAAKAYSNLSETNPAERLIQFLGREDFPSNALGHIAAAIVSDQEKEATDQLTLMVSSLSLKQQQELVNAMCTRPDAARLLVRWIESGLVSAMTLRNAQALEQIQSAIDVKTFHKLTQKLADLPAPNETIQDIIDQRIAQYDQAEPDLENGSKLFEQACSICHQINRKGSLVGPQLDGIGSRGLERVMEDILAPNRNMDIAFQPVRVKLKDGEMITGLPRRTEGNLHILANVAGQEVSIASNDIQDKEPLTTSIMPGNFGELFDEQALRDLVGFLLQSEAEQP